MIEQGRDLFREMWADRADQFSPAFRTHVAQLMAAHMAAHDATPPAGAS